MTTMAATKTTAADKTMAGISNVVKLLPTTTLFAFETLNPSFSNRGECLTANRYLSASLIVICSVSCAFLSITDSIFHDGKLFFGIATFRGFRVLNFDTEDEKEWVRNDRFRKRYRLKVSDGVHVVFTVVVFLALAFSDANVQECFFSSADANGRQLLENLPLGLGFLASLVFVIMPHSRKGIGYSDDAAGTSLPSDVAPSSEMKSLPSKPPEP